MSDYLLGIMEELSKASGYDAGKLMDLWLDNCEDTTMEEFKDITMEHDW